MYILRRYWPEFAWALFAAANLVLIFFLSDWETIPLHNVWVSLALLVAVRPWMPRFTAGALVCVTVGLTAALVYVVAGAGDAGWDELGEIPMMSAMILVVALFAWRTDRFLAAMRASVARERDFIRDVSHYLKTPITVALGHAELIRARTTDQQIADDVEIVVDEIKRISTISDRLLLLAMPEGNLIQTRDEVDPALLAKATARRWKAAAPREWSADTETEGGVIMADAERLTLALDCLVENAVRATEDGDWIAIRSRSEDGRAVLEVSDSGEGIAPEDQEQIFERFERRSRSGGSRSGAGLGLALAKSIVEAHDGSLEVESAPGDGATFRIRLGALHLPLPITAVAYLDDDNGDGSLAFGEAASDVNDLVRVP